jgi:hypothetical protein
MGKIQVPRLRLIFQPRITMYLEFFLEIVELKNGPINFSHERLMSLNYNPLISGAGMVPFCLLIFMIILLTTAIILLKISLTKC